MAVLSPTWSSKRETARRLRQRIGAVMKWVIAQGLHIDNPAREPAMNDERTRRNSARE